MKSIFLLLITVFCATTSAGRPGVRNNLKFECKGTSSYQKTGDTIYGVITGCGDGLQKEIELMTKKVERLFKQDKVRITFDVDYSQNLLLPEEEKQFLWNKGYGPRLQFREKYQLLTKFLVSRCNGIISRCFALQKV